MREQEVNCIGYASFRLGFDQEERFIPPPSLGEILAFHDEVSDISSAEVIGVVKPGGNDYHTGPTVCHMAIVESDGLISHRRKFGEEVTRETFEAGLDNYIKRPEDFTIIFLVRKVQQASS